MFVGNDSLIDPRSYAIDVITASAARAFLAEHHYLAQSARSCDFGQVEERTLNA